MRTHWNSILYYVAASCSESSEAVEQRYLGIPRRSTPTSQTANHHETLSQFSSPAHFAHRCRSRALKVWCCLTDFINLKSALTHFMWNLPATVHLPGIPGRIRWIAIPARAALHKHCSHRRHSYCRGRAQSPAGWSRCHPLCSLHFDVWPGASVANRKKCFIGWMSMSMNRSNN